MSPTSASDLPCVSRHCPVMTIGIVRLLYNRMRRVSGLYLEIEGARSNEMMSPKIVDRDCPFLCIDKKEMPITTTCLAGQTKHMRRYVRVLWLRFNVTEID